MAGAGDLAPWAERFSLLGDPGRLRLLFCVHQVPGIRVGDLAAAVGMSESATSHALRLLRASGWVATERDGRSVRCRLADDVVHDLLHHLGPPHG
jgi:DNA-binding transcriptional ArsR family regulator